MDHTKWLDEEEMEMWLAFIGAGALVDREIDQRLKEDAGLSHLQYEILVWLHEAPGHAMRMTELAERLINSKSGLTYQIGRLEKTGLVRRRPCESNSRGVMAELTGQGLAMLERAAPGHVAAVRELVVDVLTPEERDTIAAGLGKIRDRLLQGRGEACW